MSNFNFIKTDFPDLYTDAVEAEKLIWFPRAAWEPSMGRAASCFVTQARRDLHYHAARGNESK
jgi:hypothetical protein